MKTLKGWIMVFMVLAAGVLASCSSEEDGDWRPMVWEPEVPVVHFDDGSFGVSANGETFTFVCKNYSSPWIEYAASGKNSYYPPRESNDYRTVKSDWFEAKIVGRKLTVTFKENDDEYLRPLELTVTAGDIFYTFKFTQSMKIHEKEK